MKTKEIKLAIVQNATNRDDVWQWWYNQNPVWISWQDYKQEGVKNLNKQKFMIRRQWKRKVNGKTERGFQIYYPIGLFVLTKESDGKVEVEYYNRDDRIMDDSGLAATGLKVGAKPLFV